jgi:hypothetical protein
MKAAPAILLALALAACSKEQPADGESAGDYAARAGVGADGIETPATQVAEINAQPVIASEGSAALTPLAADASRSLGPIKGGCTFAYQGRALLTVGAPDSTDAAGKGVLVIDGRPIILPGADSGGPQVMESGPTLSGGGFAASVMRAEGSPRAVAGGNQWPADLVVSGPNGETKFSPGTWTCAS